jgi:hypothetical protein
MQIGHLMFELHAFLLFQVDDLEIDLEDERISQSFLVEGGLKNHTQIKRDRPNRTIRFRVICIFVLFWQMTLKVTFKVSEFCGYLFLKL